MSEIVYEVPKTVVDDSEYSYYPGGCCSINSVCNNSVTDSNVTITGLSPSGSTNSSARV